jgi:hypothetical protein
LEFLRMTHNDQVLLQVGYFIMSSPEQMLIENILLKIRFSVWLYSSSPNQSTAMQIVEVSMSSPTCNNTHVGGSCFFTHKHFLFLNAVAIISFEL